MSANWDVAEPVSTHNSVNETDTFKRNVDGKNVKNIAARTNRGIGTVNQIMSILDDICFGKYYFKVAMVFRNSLLLSSLLTNAEAWYNLSDNDVKELEK